MTAAGHDYAAEADAAQRIAVEAAELVRGYHGGQLDVQSKPGNEPVTAADHAASALIVARLRAAFPDDVILSEEVPDDRSRLGRDRVWMVDPIDGTRDFIMGFEGFVVMIGLAVEGRPRVGAVAHPPTGRVCSGVVGAGAWMTGPDGSRTPMHTSTIATPPGIRLVASKSHRTARIDAVRKALGIEDELNVGSIGLKMALVAQGTRDLYVYPGSRTKIWDTCAPEAILARAGGRLTDLFGTGVDYAELRQKRGLVASNGVVHDEVTGKLGPMFQALRTNRP
jgi:3'(2'), 5'-bisphosphate nucleotidase